MDTSRQPDSVQEIVRNVRSRIRTKQELRKCGCEPCKEALKELEG